VIWNGIYDLSIGPVCFVIICECSATKVRSKTIALATAVQAFMGIVMTIAIPYMINPDQANMRGKLGFFFGECMLRYDSEGEKLTTASLGGLAAVCCIWSWFRVPETKGRTYEELDLMFERGVKTREFKNYKVI
jgi:MFS transporter, SP family, general alpha glucoside:H+ symporter